MLIDQIINFAQLMQASASPAIKKEAKTLLHQPPTSIRRRTEETETIYIIYMVDLEMLL